MAETVGLIGLGIMGKIFADHLLAAGFTVIGYDIDPERMERFSIQGGGRRNSPAEIANEASVILSVLPSDAALEDVIGGPNGLVDSQNRRFILVECSTLSLAAKHGAYSSITEIGCKMLDCTISGTGEQASRKDLSFYGSGDLETLNRVRPILEHLGRQVFFLGAFGNGTKMKLVANLLVAIHNVAAAEAIVLSRKAGLDLPTMFEAISAGAGSSRMFEIRGPMMINGGYGTGESSRLDVFKKDLKLIGAFCEEVGSAAPVYALCSQFYQSAILQGWEELDPGAVCKVFERLSGLDGSAGT